MSIQIKFNLIEVIILIHALVVWFVAAAWSGGYGGLHSVQAALHADVRQGAVIIHWASIAAPSLWIPTQKLVRLTSSVFHLRMHQLQVIRDKQAISAADLTWEQYIFCGPSPGIFLLILCFSLMTMVFRLYSLTYCNVGQGWTLLHSSVLLSYLPSRVGAITGELFVSWEPEGRYHYSKMFCWEPEGRDPRRHCAAIAPFLFLAEHLWILIAPFWLSTDKLLIVMTMEWPCYSKKFCWEPEGHYRYSKMFCCEPEGR